MASSSCSLLFVVFVVAMSGLVVGVKATIPGKETPLDTTAVGQIHLAFLPSGVAVSFFSESPLSSSPSVNWGVSPNSLTNTASGSSSTYDNAGYFHDVVINGLAPFTQYYYMIVQDQSSAVYSFMSARAPGDSTSHSLVVVGDMGVENSAGTMQQIRATMNETEWYLHIGDISYADDYYLRPAPNNQYEASWNDWMQEMQDVTSVKGYMVLPGNHEATCTEVLPFLCPHDEKNFTAYRHRFRMPFQESGAVNNMWYSFDYGLVHYIQISTETDFPSAPEGPGTWLDGGPFGPQLQWLLADLQAATTPQRRALVPWIIVSGHRPFYSSAGGCDACRSAFEPFLNQYDVDLYFSGHVHWYERNYAIAPGGKIVSTDYINPTAPVYVVQGASGNVEGHASGSQQPFTAFINNQDYGYGRLNIFNSTTLSWGFYRGSDNSLVDSFTLVKDKH